jgi:hypothetical protein
MNLRGSLRTSGAAPISLFSFQDIIFAATGIFLWIAVMMTLFGKITQISTEALDETQAARTRLDRLAERKIVAAHQQEVLESDHPPTVSRRLLQRQSQLNEEIGEAFGHVWLYELSEILQHNANLRRRTDQLYKKLASKITKMNRREHRLEQLQSGAYQRLQEEDLAILRKGPAHDFREPIFLLIDADKYAFTYPGRPELDKRLSTTDGLVAHLATAFSPATQSIVIQLKPSGIKYFEQAKNSLAQLGYRIGYEPVPENFGF